MLRLLLVLCLAVLPPRRDGLDLYESSSVLPYSGATLGMRLEVAQTWPEIMNVFGLDARFRDEYWGRAPFLGHAPSAAACFSVADVRQAATAGEMLAGQNAILLKNPETFEVAPGLPRGSRITSEVLEQGLLNGTMVLNDAGAGWAQLFDVARAGVRALQLPVGINVYITHSSLERSTPVHSDRQDVLVVQCEGRKHWRVHPPAVVLPAEHQERGKSGDHVTEAEAGPPLLEATLAAGDLLYVPRGFLHGTTSPPPGDQNEGFSTSLTVGVQTESMGLTYDKLLLCTLFLDGEGPALEELRQLQSSHGLLRRPLPLPGVALLGKDGPEDSSDDKDLPMETAISLLLAQWRTLVPGSSPPPLHRLRKAARILAEGHRQTLKEYESRMFDASVPRKLRQEVWKRRYGALFYNTLGRCGFLTRCFPQKFWLPKHTTRQRCWGSGPGS